MKCQPGSLYDEYLSRLIHVRTWLTTDDGDLVLDLWADAGQMILTQRSP